MRGNMVTLIARHREPPSQQAIQERGGSCRWEWEGWVFLIISSGAPALYFPPHTRGRQLPRGNWRPQLSPSTPSQNFYTHLHSTPKRSNFSQPQLYSSHPCQNMHNQNHLKLNFHWILFSLYFWAKTSTFRSPGPPHPCVKDLCRRHRQLQSISRWLSQGMEVSMFPAVPRDITLKANLLSPPV